MPVTDGLSKGEKREPKSLEGSIVSPCETIGIFWFATDVNPRFLLIEIEGKLGTDHMRISLDLSEKT